jgi:hypothetical protein
MSTGWSTAVEPLGPGYRAVLDRAIGALSGDERILALFLAGSVGRGVADASSDLDLLVFVDDEVVPALLDAAEEFVASVVGPTLLARRLHSGITTVTPAWERVDLLIAPRSSAARSRCDAVIEDFDHVEVAQSLPTEPPPSVRDPRAVAFTCEEFLRVLGLLEVILLREEYLVGVEGVGLLRGHLRDLLIQESNRPRATVKRLNQRLGDEQRAILSAQPAVVATRASIVEGHLAVAQSFLPRARSLCAELVIAWPQEFEDATRAHLERRAGVTIPA